MAIEMDEAGEFSLVWLRCAQPAPQKPRRRAPLRRTRENSNGRKPALNPKLEERSDNLVALLAFGPKA